MHGYLKYLALKEVNVMSKYISQGTESVNPRRLCISMPYNKSYSYITNGLTIYNSNRTERSQNLMVAIYSSIDLQHRADTSPVCVSGRGRDIKNSLEDGKRCHIEYVAGFSDDHR